MFKSTQRPILTDKDTFLTDIQNKVEALEPKLTELENSGVNVGRQRLELDAMASTATNSIKQQARHRKRIKMVEIYDTFLKNYKQLKNTIKTLKTQAPIKMEEKEELLTGKSKEEKVPNRLRK